MELVGGFHKVEIEGKQYFKYHNFLKPSPQTRSLDSSGNLAIDSDNYLPLQPLFFCPRFRTKSLLDLLDDYDLRFFETKENPKTFSKYGVPPLYDDARKGHHLLPLFWCNNKEAGPEGECYACRIQSVGTDYYFCAGCDKRYHKECVETPLEISHPSHPKHYLELYFSKHRSDYCIYCRKRAPYAIYYCALCDVYMHVLCAKATIPFFIDQPKKHDHTLTLFPRQASLVCNVCGVVNKLHLTYVCRSICDFVAHKDCIYIPQTIRISRHHHRISFVFSLPLEDRFCGVCRRKVDSEYGAYTCKACFGYAVHIRCALRVDIWDGIELEGVPEVEDYVEPFEKITDGIILHFSHGHHLKFDTVMFYDAYKFCQACALPIYGDGFYVCVDGCNFILHETCANAPRKKLHPLHPYPLKLKTMHKESIFGCSVCTRTTNGFVYECSESEMGYRLCIRCALASEPFKYDGHQHPLFLSLDPKEKPMCHVCKSRGDHKVLNCIECDFIICFKCATLPYMVRYEHDEHYLTFCHGDEASDSDWCELCEGKLAIGGNVGFYKCNDCCTTLHIDCLLGREPYLKPGSVFLSRRDGKTIRMHIRHNNSLSRPVCFLCCKRCPYPVFLLDSENVYCFFICK